MMPILVLLLMAEGLAAADGSPTVALRSIAEVLATPAARLRTHPAVVVQGIVTLSVPKMMVIQDGAQAIFVSGPRFVEDLGADPTIPLGSRIELSGQAVPGDYSPTLIAERGRLIGRGSLPAARPVSFGRLLRGADIGLRVMVRGIVQGVGVRSETNWTLVIATDGGLIVALFPRRGEEPPPTSLIDAEVNVTGLIGAIHNSRGEFVGPEIVVVTESDIEILEPPVMDFAALPLVPLSAIARYRPNGLSRHRIRTAGTVSFATPDLLFIADADVGVRVDLAPQGSSVGPREPTFQAGDTVDVIGFLDVSRNIASLSGSLAVHTGTAEPPQPVSVRFSELSRLDREFQKTRWTTDPGSLDGRLVRCAGRIEGLETSYGGQVVTLLADGKHWFAEMTAAEAAVAGSKLAVGSEVEITGILQVDLQALRVNGLLSNHPVADRITVLPRSASDVTLIRPPPWWTPRRLAVGIAGLVAALAAITVGAAFLGREVRRQAAALARNHQTQQEATIAFEAALRERSRLATNLHDTVLQTVTGIGYQLQVCAAASVSGELATPIRVAHRMVSHSIAQLRGAVWELHAPLVDGQPFVVALESRIEQLGADHTTPVHYSVTGSERPLRPTVAANLLLVGQEAVLNALRHSAASAISVVVAFEADAITLTVRDDGRGFQLGDQPGAEFGHFGIVGMIDRMEAVDGECRVTSQPGMGTVIVARAPAGGPRKNLSDREGDVDSEEGILA